MTQKSCAVGMRNAILRNYLKLPSQDAGDEAVNYRFNYSFYLRRLECLTIRHLQSSTKFIFVLFSLQHMYCTVKKHLLLIGYESYDNHFD